MKLNNVRSKIVKAGKDASVEMHKLNEIHRLNTKVNSEKRKINSLYMEIGKKLYDMYREEPLENFEKEFRSIGESFNEIEKLEIRIRKVKGVTICPNCGAEVNIGEKLCSNCGCRMPEDSVKCDGNPGDEFCKAEPEENCEEEEGSDESAEPEENCGEEEGSDESAEPEENCEEEEGSDESAEPEENCDAEEETAAKEDGN